MTRARLVRTVIRHHRSAPVHHRFAYRSYSWLVDVDELPVLPWPWRALAGFHSRDHLGDPDVPLRDNVVRYLAGHGIDLCGGRILMLANARVLGYVFNPLTVYWCHDPGGALRCVVAEVHNTYGERHRYLVESDTENVVAKQFYVSPFNPVAGRYRLRLPEPTDQLGLAIALERPDGRTVFAATVVGRVLPADRRTVARTLLAHPLETLRIAARIRWQGLRLRARGLPIVARESSVPQEALP
ncbi:DUF1365 domain-containing protein [Nocardia tengchongensis]|uniref:DUF1365 domain-containing protein n=1 Tax=Nocardia tengchongensis TaxID=2055889 RepID=UPI00367C1ED0